MSIMISQGLALVAILLIAAIAFVYFPLKITTRDLSLAAFLVMLSVALSFLSVMVPLFGFMSFKIGFSQMPLMLLGILLGPSWAVIGGLVQDLLDIMINASGFPFLGFTLNKVLIATIPALWFSKWNKLSQKQVFRLIWICLGIIYALVAIGVWSTGTIKVGDQMVALGSDKKLLLTGACSLIMGLLAVIILHFKRKYPYETTRYHIANWIICVLMIEIMIQLTLTPIWLEVMYGIPYIMNVLVRLIKSSFMIFLTITIGYFVLKTILKIRR